MDNIEVRPATARDAGPMADNHARCFRATYARQLRDGAVVAPDSRGMREQFRDWLAPRSGFETWVAERDGVVIGHVTVRGNQLVHLFIDPPYHGTGLGRRLLAWGEAQIAAAGYPTLELHTRVDNSAAIGFYQAAGWSVTDQVIHSAEHSVAYDEVVLVKP